MRKPKLPCRRYFTIFYFANGARATTTDCGSYAECDECGKGWSEVVFKSPIVKFERYSIDFN